jgi:hypothetical protein
MELYSQISALVPGLFKYAKEFGFRYLFSVYLTPYRNPVRSLFLYREQEFRRLCDV